MVWYDASVGAFVAMSPEWGAEAVGLGPSRAAAVDGLEALVAHLEQASVDDGGARAAHRPAPLVAALEWERGRRGDAPAHEPAHEPAGASPAPRYRRRSPTPV
jgi:hypothetical protein